MFYRHSLFIYEDTVGNDFFLSKNFFEFDIFSYLKYIYNAGINLNARYIYEEKFRFLKQSFYSLEANDYSTIDEICGDILIQKYIFGDTLKKLTHKEFSRIQGWESHPYIQPSIQYMDFQTTVVVLREFLLRRRFNGQWPLLPIIGPIGLTTP